MSGGSSGWSLGGGSGGSSGTGEGRRRLLEGVIPEILKRAVERGVEKATEAPDTLKQFVGDLKVPKEVAALILAQLDDTKNDLFRVVAKEMRDFLEHTNLAGEMKKMLTTVQFEINTTIRFTPNEGAMSTGTTEPPEGADKGADARESTPPQAMPASMIPEVKTDVQVTSRESRPPRRRPRE